MRAAFSNGYAKLFERQWPVWIAGLLLGMGNVLLFAYARPWSVASGARNWGDWIFNSTAVMEMNVISPHLFSTSLTNFGIILGAMVAALFARQFQVRMAPARELLKGLLGGALMGIGAVLAFGCNVGGFFSAISALSMGGVAMMFGLLVGVLIGLKLLVWEIEYLPAPSWGVGKAAKKKSGSSAGSRKVQQPIAGLVVLSLTIVLIFTYDAFDYPTRGGFVLFGLLAGIVMQRTRFCFVRAFREPFMTGDADATKAVAVAVIISVTGFTILKWTDLREWETFVFPGFWFGSFVGGIIFGIGMSFAGGCASGSLWRAGEGQVKLWVALVGFALVGSVFRIWLVANGLRAKLGTQVFLPDIIGWKMALLSIVGLMALWYLLATWNQVKKKLVLV
jgi:uncharacterized membrane protein YedE/YeeE